MKKTILFSVILFGLFSLIFFSCREDDDKISFSQLPTPAQSFIGAYFNGVGVSKIEKDDDGGEYKVYLENGFVLEFFSNGEWREVDGGNQPLPPQLLDDLIPTEALAYVANNYPNNSIIEIAKRVFGFEIELNTIPETDLHFDNNGSVITIQQ